MYAVYCSRCDKRWEDPSREVLTATVRKHVELQHPDHDPNWSVDW